MARPFTPVKATGKLETMYLERAIQRSIPYSVVLILSAANSHHYSGMPAPPPHDARTASLADQLTLNTTTGWPAGPPIIG
jgi:hypothetical protein